MIADQSVRQPNPEAALAVHLQVAARQVSLTIHQEFPCEHREAHPVKARQTGSGSGPQVAIRRLRQVVHGVLREVIFGCPAVQGEWLRNDCAWQDLRHGCGNRQACRSQPYGKDTMEGAAEHAVLFLAGKTAQRNAELIAAVCRPFWVPHFPALASPVHPRRKLRSHIKPGPQWRSCAEFHQNFSARSVVSLRVPALLGWRSIV